MMTIRTNWLPILAGVVMLMGAVMLPNHVASAQQETPVPAEEVADDIVDVTVEAAENTAGMIENLINRLTQAPRSDVIRVLLVIGGVILLVAGWRVYEYVILIAGFVIGASIAVSLITTDNGVIEIAAFLIGGLVGAGLSFFLYNVAVFLMGTYLGILLTNGLGTLLGLAPISPVVLLIGGIIGGIVLLGLSFEFLIVIAALVGAQMLSLGLGLNATWTLLFAAISLIVQFGLVRTSRYQFRRRRNRYFFRPRRV